MQERKLPELFLMVTHVQRITHVFTVARKNKTFFETQVRKMFAWKKGVQRIRKIVNKAVCLSSEYRKKAAGMQVPLEGKFTIFWERLT